MNQIEIKKRRIEICSHVIGLVTLLALGYILKDNGIAYVAFAMESFMLFWTITGGGVADTLGRLLRGRSAKGQYRNAAKLRRNALLLEGAVGAVGSVLLFACAGLLGEHLLSLHYCVFMIRLLSPVIFLRTMSSLLLGCFQGEGTELPTAIVSVMRQVCILIFSLLFANLFMQHGYKIGALLREENFAAMHGGLGVALAVLIAEALVLLFLLLVYRGSHRKERKGTGAGMRTTDSFVSQVRILYGSWLPVMFTAFLQQLPIWLGLFFYRNSIADLSGLNDYGVFYGRYLTLTGIWILPGCALLLGSSYKVAGCVRREEPRYARGNFSGGLHMGVLYGVFLSLFMTVMAPQIAGIFGGNAVDLLTKMLRFGSFLILFTVLGSYFSEILTLLGGKFQVMGALALYDLVFIVSLIAFLNGGKMGIMAVLNAGILAAGVFMAACGALILYQTGLGVNWIQSVAIPAGVACAVCLIVFFIAKALTPHLGNPVTVGLCLVVGLICDWVVLLFLNNFREQELSYMPGGAVIRAIGQMLKIY